MQKSKCQKFSVGDLDLKFDAKQALGIWGVRGTHEPMLVFATQTLTHLWYIVKYSVN